jgi:hypothetical protein
MTTLSGPGSLQCRRYPTQATSLAKRQRVGSPVFSVEVRRYEMARSIRKNRINARHEVGASQAVSIEAGAGTGDGLQVRHSSFTAVYDACVLYPAPLRDFLIRLDQHSHAQEKSLSVRAQSTRGRQYRRLALCTRWHSGNSTDHDPYRSAREAIDACFGPSRLSHQSASPAAMLVTRIDPPLLIKLARRGTDKRSWHVQRLSQYMYGDADVAV